MSKQYAPHEPSEELLSSVEDAFHDAEQSEARWQAFERGQGLKRVLIELPEPAYSALEDLAKQQDKTVPRLIERIVEELLIVFGPLLKQRSLPDTFGRNSKSAHCVLAADEDPPPHRRK